VEDGMERKMMELEAIKVENTPDERVEWKPQPMDEKRHEAYPLVLLGMEDGFLHDESSMVVSPRHAKAVSGGGRYLICLQHIYFFKHFCSCFGL
jgi:hypothetical protein